MQIFCYKTVYAFKSLLLAKTIQLYHWEGDGGRSVISNPAARGAPILLIADFSVLLNFLIRKYQSFSGETVKVVCCGDERITVRV